MEVKLLKMKNKKAVRSTLTLQGIYGMRMTNYDHLWHWQESSLHAVHKKTTTNKAQVIHVGQNSIHIQEPHY